MISEEKLKKLIEIFDGIVEKMSEYANYSDYSVYHYNSGIRNGLEMVFDEEVIPVHIKELLEREE